MITITVRTVKTAIVGIAFVAATAGMVALFMLTPHATLVMP